MEITKNFITNIGFNVELKVINWARAIVDVRRGKYQILAAAYKQDAPDFIFPKTPLTTSTTCFFVKNSYHWKFQNLDSLKTEILGIANDYSYGSLVDNYIKENSSKIQRVSGKSPLLSNIRKLLLNRITVLIEDRHVFNYKIKQEGFNNLFKSAGCLPPYNVYIAFSPNRANSKKLADLLDMYLKKPENTLFINKNFNKYFTRE